MNIHSTNTHYSNAVTPFAASASSEVTNPENALPLPPIKQSPDSDRTGDRESRQALAQPTAAEEEEASVQEDGSAKPTDNTKKVAGRELTEQELATLMQLKARDREVRAHEQAHEAVGGQYAGAASYEYERGPDGGRYAIGGEVPIRIPKGEGDPEQKIRQAEQVIRAALAPAEPSAQDRSVAARAMQVKTEAQTELRELSDADRVARADKNEARSEPEHSRQQADINPKEEPLPDLYTAYNHNSAAAVGTRLHNQV